MRSLERLWEFETFKLNNMSSIIETRASMRRVALSIIQKTKKKKYFLLILKHIKNPKVTNFLPKP